MRLIRTQKKRSPDIIALLTDFGYKDPYAGIMKGVITKINPDARIIDLTHGIKPQNVLEAAFCLFESYRYFPDHTIFVCVVDPGVGGERKNIIIQTKRYFFVGPDNGIFTMLINDTDFYNGYEISNKAYQGDNISDTFHGRDIFAPVAAHLTKGIQPEKIGHRIDNITKIDLPGLNETDDHYKGFIIYIDGFGNLITNVENKYTEKIKQIIIKSTAINGVSTSYEQGKTGKPIALKGSSGYIEIAVNSGNASNVLGAATGDSLIIEKII